MPIPNIGFGQTRILNWAQTMQNIHFQRERCPPGKNVIFLAKTILDFLPFLYMFSYTNVAWFSDCKFDLCRISLLIGRRQIPRKCNRINSLFSLFAEFSASSWCTFKKFKIKQDHQRWRNFATTVGTYMAI